MLINEVFVDINDLLDEILSSDFIKDYSIICNFEDAQTVVKRLFLEDDNVPVSIELTDPVMDGYTDEYIVSASKERYEIFCEPAKRGDTYIDCFDGFIFILPSCSNEYREKTKKNADTACFIVEFSEDYDEEDDDDMIEITECKDGDRTGYIVRINKGKNAGLEWYFDIKDVLLEMIGINC